MRIQHTFFKTWENLKIPEERAAKAKELAEARKWGAATVGATASTFAISGIYKALEKKKEKKKESEMKSKFSK